MTLTSGKKKKTLFSGINTYSLAEFRKQRKEYSLARKLLMREICYPEVSGLSEIIIIICKYMHREDVKQNCGHFLTGEKILLYVHENAYLLLW